jgi:hypothetical protein
VSPEDIDAVADVVAQAIQEAVTPVLERLTAVETRVGDLAEGWASVGPLRERVVILETKSARPELPLIDLTPVLERVAAAEARLQTLGDLRDQVVILETKAAMPAAPAVAAIDLTPMLERLAGAEARLETVGDRVRTIDTRATTGPPLDDLAVEDMAASVAGLLRKELADLETAIPAKVRKRIAKQPDGYTVTEEPA